MVCRHSIRLTRQLKADSQNCRRAADQPVYLVGAFLGFKDSAAG